MNRAFYNLCRGIYRVFSLVTHPVKVVGAENIPETGKAILCANHQSFQDPLLLATYLKRPMHFMAKKELFQNKLLAKIMDGLGAYPVARGENDLTAIRTSFKLLSEEKMLGIFPEGKRFHDGEMHALQSGVSMIALRSGARVIPACIDGNYKLFRKITLRIGACVELSDLGGKCDQATLKVSSERLGSAMKALSEKE